MRLNLVRFKIAAKKRNQTKENVPIGSAIKFKRNALKMTLEEASKDICSISYLSKLENNIIIPSEKYVIQLKQRFCIEEESSMIEEEVYQQLKSKLISVLVNNRSLPIQFLIDTGFESTYQTLLLKLGYHVINHEKKESHETYYQIIPVISSMPDEEFSILVSIVSKMLYEEMRYQESSETLTLLPEEVTDLSIELFRDKWLLINAIHMDNHALFHMIYPKYQQTLIQVGHYKQVNELKFTIISYFANAMSISAFQHLLSEHPRIPTNLKSLAIARNMLFNHQYEAVIKYASFESNKSDHDWYIIKLFAYDALANQKEIIKLLQLNKHRILSNTQSLIASFIKAKYTYEKETLLSYLRTMILGDQFLTDDVHTLRFLQQSAHALFKSHFFYKEASEVFTKFSRMIDRLKRSDYFFNKEPKALFFRYKISM